MINTFHFLEPYPAPFLYTISKNEVKAIDLLTVGTTHVARGLKFVNPMSITIDTVEKRLYLRNGSDIVKSRLDGTDTEIILKNVKAEDMTIEWIRRRIFWIHWNQKMILVANHDGKEKRVLKVTQYLLVSIAVDPIIG